MEEINYLEINKKSWNNRTDTHLKSEFYDLERFLKGKSSLNDIELKLLGDLKGKSILHLQCHFDQDTNSLSKLGAEFHPVVWMFELRVWIIKSRCFTQLRQPKVKRSSC